MPGVLPVSWDRGPGGTQVYPDAGSGAGRRVARKTGYSRDAISTEDWMARPLVRAASATAGVAVSFASLTVRTPASINRTGA